MSRFHFDFQHIPLPCSNGPLRKSLFLVAAASGWAKDFKAKIGIGNHGNATNRVIK